MQNTSAPNSAPPVFNPDIMIEICGNNPKIIQEFVGLFFKQAPQQLSALNQACTEGNLHDIREVSHKIKGVAVYIGAEKMSSLAGQIEHGADQEDLESCRKLMPDIQNSLKELTAEVQRIYPAS